jgi:hypothetical protein
LYPGSLLKLEEEGMQVIKECKDEEYKKKERERREGMEWVGSGGKGKVRGINGKEG